MRRLLFLTAPMLLASAHARADCSANGNDVLCTGSDPDGYVAPAQPARLTVVPGATVHNFDNGGFNSTCDELALPSIYVGNGSVVDNQGVVTAMGVCGMGISTGDRSTVTSSGQIVTYWTLGIGISGGDELTARVSGGITTYGLTGYGIVGGDRSVITTSGAITTSGEASMDVVAGGGAQILNSGALRSAGTTSDGINAGANARLTNTGSIIVTGAQSAAMSAAGGAAVIINSGTLSALFVGSTDAPRHAAAIDASGESIAVTNSGTVAGTYAAAKLSGQGVTLTNSGSMTATGETRSDGSFSSGSAVIVTSGPAQIVNSGQITAQNGLPAFRGSGATTFTNSGTVTGDILFGAADDTFLPVGNSVTTGVIDGGGGNDTVLLAGSGVFSGRTANMELLTKSGAGAWVLHGAPVFAAQANIIDGTLQVAADGRLTTPMVNVVSGGMLSGAGVVTGAVTNAGTVAPAGLTVTGAFTQTPSGSLAMTVRGDGTSDRLVAGGLVTLGGALRITYDTALATGAFTGTRSYRLIAPASGALAVQGAFATVLTNAPFIDTHLSASAAGMDLTIARLSYGAAAATASQRSAGALLDRLSVAPPSSLAAVYGALNAGTAQSAQPILAALTPEAPAAVMSLGLFTLDALREAMPETGSNSAWARFLDRQGSARRADTAPFRYTLTGEAAGADGGSGPFHFGGSVARSDGSANLSGETGGLDGTFIAAHGGYDGSVLSANAGVIYGSAHPETRRARTLLGNTETLSARGSAHLWSLYGTLDHRFVLGPLTLTPAATLAYDRVSLASLDESAPLSAVVTSARMESLRGEAGVRASAAVGDVRPYVGLRAIGEFLDGRDVPAQLHGIVGSDFVVAGARPRKVSLVLDGGLAADVAPGLSLHAGARFSANDVFAGRTLSAGLTYRW